MDTAAASETTKTTELAAITTAQKALEEAQNLAEKEDADAALSLAKNAAAEGKG